MAQDLIHVLSTRPLDARQIQSAKEAGIEIEVVSFIETEMISNPNTMRQISNVLHKKIIVVFTSMNAVLAVGQETGGFLPDWVIFCIGHGTKELVQKYFGNESIKGTASDASSLALLISESVNTEEIYFFCGDRRREELPLILKKHNIKVHELIVYNTISLPKKISNKFQGIMFFSPSAVDSFFVNNTPDADVVIFVIGKTTATQVNNYVNNSIIVSLEPGKESMVMTMIEFYSRNGANQRKLTEKDQYKLS